MAKEYVHGSTNHAAQHSVGFMQEAVGGEDVALIMVHDDGEFDLAAGGFEEVQGGVAGEAGEAGDDAGGAVDEFGVFGGVDIDHEVAVGLADADHGEGGDAVEDELGGGAGFKAGGSGEDFGAGVEGEEEVGDAGGQLDVGGVGADQEDGFGLARWASMRAP